MSRWSREKLNKVLDAANYIVLAITKPLRPFRLSGTVKFFVDSSEDRRVQLLTIDLPGSKPYVLAMYVTAQERRALSPRDIAKRYRRLKRFLAKKAPAMRDTTIVFVAAARRTRTTRGARRILAGLRVVLARPSDVLRIVGMYVQKRLQGLYDLQMRKQMKLPKQVEDLIRVFEELHQTLNYSALIGPPS